MQDTFILVALIFKLISAALTITAAVLWIKAILAREKAEEIKNNIYKDISNRDD